MIATDSSRAPEPFGKYLLDREIARGGMARVHLARLRGLGGFEKRLVVKQILPHLASDPRFVEMFVEEAKTLVQMSHPHIVPVYELGVVEGVYFLAMEYVEGATLADVLDDGPLDEAEAAHAGAQICDALSYAHDRFAIVHRDVTPRNVMIDAGGHCRLLDFGIAAPASDAETDGGLFGTPGYLSPEQARGEAIAASSDLFSLGAVLWHALAGAPPEATRTIEGARALRPGDARPALGGEVDRGLAAIVERALDPDPGARFADARAMGRALRGWLAARHPEGVAPELGVRAERARARREQGRAGGRAVAEGDATGTAKIARTPSARTVGARAAGGARVETLAQSRALEEIVGGTAALEAEAGAGERSPGTVPLPRRSAEPSAPARRARRPIAVAGIALGIAAVAVWASLGHGTRIEREPETEAATETETETETEAETEYAARPAPVPEPVPAPEPAIEPVVEPAPAPADPARAGQLAVTATRGWATVEIDGRALGATPIRRAQLAPGVHTIVARSEVLGREARTRVEIAPGARVHAVVDLDAARITVRER